jgi:hypothetical protein
MLLQIIFAPSTCPQIYNVMRGRLEEPEMEFLNGIFIRGFWA